MKTHDPIVELSHLGSQRRTQSVSQANHITTNPLLANLEFTNPNIKRMTIAPLLVCISALGFAFMVATSALSQSRSFCEQYARDFARRNTQGQTLRSTGRGAASGALIGSIFGEAGCGAAAGAAYGGIRGSVNRSRDYDYLYRTAFNDCMRGRTRYR